MAYRLRAGFVPVQARQTSLGGRPREYELEYGTDRLEIHRDTIRPDERVLVVDDVLATGGTAEATCKLVEALGGTVVGIAVLLELEALGGNERLRVDGSKVC